MVKIKIVMAVLFVIVAGVFFVQFGILQDARSVTLLDGSSIKSRKIISQKRFTFVCDDTALGHFTLVELKKEPGKAFINVDGKIFALTQTRSASGAKYTSIPPSIVFWTKKNEAVIQKNDITLHDACRVIPFNLTEDTVLFRMKLSGYINSAVINIEGAKNSPQLSVGYTDGDVRGRVILLLEKMTTVSKVGNIHLATYFVVPYAITSQGTGVFWNAALVREDMAFPGLYTYIDSYSLGDRIDDIHIKDQIAAVDVSFKEHAEGQAMADLPSLERTVRLSIDPEKITAP